MPTGPRRPHAPTPARAATLSLLASLALLAGACGAPASSFSGTNEPPTLGPVTPAPNLTPDAEPVTPSAPPLTPSPAAELTPVPGGGSGAPVDPDGPPTTTVTDWGTILDRVPDGFPVHPAARTAPELLDEPASGAWLAEDEVDAVAAWYAEALEALAWSSVELGDPLEDGSRVLDAASDLPECRMQATFRPADGSTMIVVLYGAGCAGGEG